MVHARVRGANIVVVAISGCVAAAVNTSEDACIVHAPINGTDIVVIALRRHHSYLVLAYMV
jgi:hypothetical protein